MASSVTLLISRAMGFAPGGLGAQGVEDPGEHQRRVVDQASRGVGRAQIDRLDVGQGQTGLGQGLDHEQMRGRALGKGHPPIAQIFHPRDRRDLGDQDHLGLAGERLDGHIAQRRTSGLREQRRRVARGAQVHRAGGEGFEQRRSRNELGPFHVHAWQNRLELPARLGQHQHAVLLIADTHAHGLRLRTGLAARSASA